MAWLQSLAAELAITMANADVWWSIAQALVLAGICLLVGTVVARRVGLVTPDAPAAETIGVGLASGLVIMAAWWAAIASGGRSAFTPVAIGFAIAVGWAIVHPARRAATVPEASGPPAPSRAGLLVAVVVGAGFIGSVALVYGGTMELSPRDGVQPVEFMDEAYYAILGSDLAITGTEDAFTPAALGRLDGFPQQTWYHWGEAWLAAAAITVFGAAPLAARTFVVLPVLLLAATALSGTLVRRVTGTRSRGAFLLGAAACLFLAPIPVSSGPFFSDWAVGLIFGITLYGLAAVAVLLALYAITVPAGPPATWARAGFIGTVFALILPAHLLLAILAAVGVGSVWAVRAMQTLRSSRRLPAPSPAWRRTGAWTATLVVATVGWGLLTGHGIGGSGVSPSVSPFNATWRDTILIVLAGSGAFLAIPVAWVLTRRSAPRLADLVLGTMALIGAGALAWGLRLADFNMFHVFFGAIVVFGTPVAAIAVWTLWTRLQTSGHRSIALVLMVACAAQIVVAADLGILRLQRFGPGNYDPVPTTFLAEIKALPADAKIAYACQPGEELAIWDARLLAIGAHTSRRIVPMCFEADSLGSLVGGDPSLDLISPFFLLASQRALYPTSSARPSPTDIAGFMRANGIHYIYEDRAHPNALVADATVVASDREFQLLQLP